MFEPLVLHPSDTIAVLTKRAETGEDPLLVGAPLAAAISAGHKVARHDIAAGEAIVKFGQFIGKATADIAQGTHVHSHNCAFANPRQEYASREGLETAIKAVPKRAALTFEGYRRADGQVGTRNYIALVATVNCSATVIKRAAAELELSGVIAQYSNVDGIVVTNNHI